MKWRRVLIMHWNRSSSRRTNQQSFRKLRIESNVDYPKYNAKVVPSLAFVDESVVKHELVATISKQMTMNEREGAILVFMPGGMMETTKTIEELYKNELFKDESQTVIYPLHSSLSMLLVGLEDLLLDLGEPSTFLAKAVRSSMIGMDSSPQIRLPSVEQKTYKTTKRIERGRKKHHARNGIEHLFNSPYDATQEYSSKRRV